MTYRKIRDTSLCLHFRKAYRFDENSFTIEYELSNQAAGFCRFRFCSHSNLLSSPHIEDHQLETYQHRRRTILNAQSMFLDDAADTLIIATANREEKLIIRADQPFLLRGKPNLVQRKSYLSRIL